MRKLYAQFVLWLIRPALELDKPVITISQSAQPTATQAARVLARSAQRRTERS